MRTRPSGAFTHNTSSNHSPRLILLRTASSVYPVRVWNRGIVTKLQTLGNP